MIKALFLSAFFVDGIKICVFFTDIYQYFEKYFKIFCNYLIISDKKI